MHIKRYIALLIPFFVFSFGGFSQGQAAKKQSKKLAKEALLYFESEDYFQAWQLYKRTLELDGNNEEAGLNAAICVNQLNYLLDSSLFLIPNLTASKQIDSKFFLAKIKHKQKEFDVAIELLNNYQKINPKKRLKTDDEINYLINACNTAKLFISQPHRSIIKNMGTTINSKYDDYVPVIMPDESVLYFSSKRNGTTHDKKNGDNSYYEDVYISRNVNSEWKMAENIGFPINTETNDACVALSPDGLRMIVYRTSADQLSGDLYITQIGLHGQWEPLQLMSKEINSPFIETSACFSNDTNEIYFSSNRPGGFGGKDLYRIRKLPNGKWGAPFNLGSSINTVYDDDAPFLHPDGVTLYFSSKGHNTMGDYDVYKSTLNKETNQFSMAENLGYPINDVGSDIFFVLSVDGQRGYYSSIKDETFGGVDIYQIDTRFGDNDLMVKRGTSYIDNAPSGVKITLIEKDTHQEVGHYSSNPNTGKFILIVNPLKSYIALAESDHHTVELEIKPMVDIKLNEVLEIRLKKNNAQ
jgi:hypothetical protein